MQRSIQAGLIATIGGGAALAMREAVGFDIGATVVVAALATVVGLTGAATD